MNTHASLKIRSGRLFITLLVAGCSLIISGTVVADDASPRSLVLFDTPLMRTLVDGELKLADVGHRAGVHMSLESATRETGALYSSPVADNLTSESGVHLSYRLSW